MSRELKFRAWWPNQKVMQYRASFGLAEGVLNHSSEWTWMQFVGLSDKHGKEVYEGDIVRGRLAENPGDMVYEVTEVVNIYEGLLAPFYMRVNFEEDWWKDALVDGFEVIGNIYENPELAPK